MEASSKMFSLVKGMNTAFGNPEGDPSLIAEKRAEHAAQCKNIGAEWLELMAAFGISASLSMTDGDQNWIMSNEPDLNTVYPPIDDVRDALCDIMVFALGAFHRMGIDADRDMQSVIDGVMTRFCSNAYELESTLKHYAELGIDVTVHGEYPRKFVRSARDQLMPECPKGKFLKSYSYRQPVFYPLPAQRSSTPAITEEMAAERRRVMQEEEDWLKWCKLQMAKFENDLDELDATQRRKFISGSYKITHNVRSTHDSNSR